MANTLKSDLKAGGLNQDDLVAFLENIRDAVNELQTQHTALRADVTAIRTSVTDITAQLDADGGVTGTDFAANNDPAALTSTALAQAALKLTAG